MFNWLKKATKSPSKSHESKPAAININEISDQQALLSYAADKNQTQELRSAAIAEISDTKTLVNLAEQHSDLLSVISSKLDLLDSQWLTHHDISESLSLQLLSKHDVNAASKEFLIEKIKDRSAASALLKKITDKQSQRLLRNKIKALSQIEKDNASTIESAQQLVEKLTHLAALPWNSQLSGKMIKLKEHWSELDEDKIPDTLKQQHMQLLQTCEATLAEHQDEQAKIDAEQAHQTQLINCIETLEAHIATLSSDTPDNCTVSEQLLEATAQQWEVINQTSTAHEKLAHSWKSLKQKLSGYITADKHSVNLDLANFSSQLASISNADNKQEKSIAAQTAQLEDMLAILKPSIKKNPWPQWLAPTEKYKQAESILSQAQTQFKQQAQIHDKTLQHVRHKNRELGNKLSEKNLIAASRLNFYINNKIETLPQKWKDEAADLMTRNLEELKKLEDLNDFATEPKKIALCEKMEKLCLESSASPEELANTIQSIQADWKASNPLARDDDPLWQRFSDAANKAWEPCAAFYADNQKEREANVQKRQQICEQLSLLLNKEDWSKTDWPSILEVEKTARKEWKQAEPIDFKLNRPVQKNFFSLLDQLKEKVTQQQNELLAEKEELTKKVEALEEVELEKAIETCKFLQQKWKSIDTLKIGEDRAQWKKFRAACDRVFKRLDEKRDADKESRKELLGKADDIINNIKKLASLDDSEILQSREQLELLKTEYQALEEIPENIAERKDRDLSKAINLYESKIDGMMQRKAMASQSKVFDLSLLLNAYETSPTDVAKQEIESIIEELSNSNLKSALKCVFKRYENPNQTKQALQQLEELTLEYEILAEVETPEAYKAQRMQFQLQQLTGKKAAEKTNSDLAPLLALDVSWAEISNATEIDQSTRETLEARRKIARSALS